MLIFNNDWIINENLKDRILKPVNLSKLLDCFDFTISEVSIVENMRFQLTDLGINYEDKGEVCLSNILYSYDYIGIKNDVIKGKIGCEDINLYGKDGLIVKDSLNDYKIYTEYLGKANIRSFKECTKIKFSEIKLQFEIKNLVITLQGTIGNDPFIGTYTYSGSIV